MMRLSNRGDTIVEVLISIAVVSLVLGGAYASSRRSLNANTRSRERSEAVAFTQEQVERLRVVARDVSKSGDLFTRNSPFCISSAPDIQNGGCTKGPDNRYDIKITRSGKVFTATTTWYQVGGDEGVASLTYRIHPL